jgi:hypothetical protein
LTSLASGTNQPMLHPGARRRRRAGHDEAIPPRGSRARKATRHSAAYRVSAPTTRHIRRGPRRVPRPHGVRRVCHWCGHGAACCETTQSRYRELRVCTETPVSLVRRQHKHDRSYGRAPQPA